MQENQAGKGYLLVIGATFFWGFQGIISSIALAANYQPLAISAFRLFFSFLMLFIGAIIFKPQILVLRLKDIPFFLTYGVLAMGIFHTVYVYAILLAGVSVTSMLLYTAPTFAVIISRVLYQEKITWQKALAIFLTLLGCLAISLQGLLVADINILGVGFGLISGFIYACWYILSKKGVSTYGAWKTNMYGMFFGSLFIFVIAIPMGQITTRVLEPKFILLIVSAALFTTVIPHLMFTSSLKFIEVGKASIMSNLELAVSIIMATVILHEVLTPGKIAGMTFIVSAILILVWKDLQKMRKVA
ncbi:MAG: DMT family transporter [Clostridia bacterium]